METLATGISPVSLTRFEIPEAVNAGMDMNKPLRPANNVGTTTRATFRGGFPRPQAGNPLFNRYTF